MHFPQKVRIREVGPRDGLQIETAFTPTDKKIKLINMLSKCGFHEIQSTAFVHPKAVPNMADAAEIMTAIERNPNTEYTTLIPNERGYIRAAEAGIGKVELTLSATDSHNINNMNVTTQESIYRIANCLKLGLGTTITGGVAVAFGCPFEGRTPYERLRWVVQSLYDLGIREIGLGDSDGSGNPRQVYEYVSRLLDAFPEITFLYHPHNTHGTAMANILAAMQAGLTTFDASVAGLGGCPYLPGASGNLATEDLVQVLHAMDIETGLDLELLIEAAKYAAEIVGHSDSTVLSAGRIGEKAACEAKHQDNRHRAD